MNCLLSSQKLIVIFKELEVLRTLGHRMNSQATKICCMYMLVIAKNKIKTNKKLNSQAMPTYTHPPLCSAWITLASDVEHLLCTRLHAINWGNSVNSLSSLNYLCQPSKLWLLSHVQHAACFCMVPKLRKDFHFKMVFKKSPYYTE